MWQRRWIGLFASWVVLGIASYMIMRMPDEYEASARIFVDTQSVLKPLMAGLAVQPDIDTQIMILSRTLISRSNVDKLLRMSDLDHTIHSPAHRYAMIDSLTWRIRIVAAGGINLYTMAFRDPNPDTAQRVVQSLTSMFVESSLGGKRRDTDIAKQFIDDQIKVYEKKLEDAEARLKNFKLRNLHLNMSDGKDSFGRMAEASALLTQARLSLREVENSRDSLKRQLAGEEPVLLGGVQDAPQMNVSVPEFDGRIDAVRRNLDSLLQRYTEQHPEVLSARRLIRDLEEQKRQEIAARRAAFKTQGPTPVGNVANNPVYQQIKISLAAAEANVATLQIRVAEYEARFNKARGSINMVPELEAEFVQLNRDYAVHRTNYDSLVTRRESAAMSREMGSTTGMAEFRVIDPPRVFPQPVAPNRPRLFSLALLGAIAAGALASFVLGQIRRPFFEAHALRDATTLPVVGTVSLIVSAGMKRKERLGLIGFMTATAALFGVYWTGLFILTTMATRA